MAHGSVIGTRRCDPFGPFHCAGCSLAETADEHERSSATLRRQKQMNIKTKLILATTAVALLSSPALARFDGDEGVASAYARFGSEGRAYTMGPAAAYAAYAFQPGNGVQHPGVRNIRSRR